MSSWQRLPKWWSQLNIEHLQVFVRKLVLIKILWFKMCTYMLTYDWFMHLFNLLLFQMHDQTLTAAFQCHAALKRFPLLSNRNLFAAAGSFGSTNLNRISLRAVVHSVTWLMRSLCYIIFLIMYEFFCSNAVQASLMSFVGFWQSPPQKKELECCAIISLN